MPPHPCIRIVSASSPKTARLIAAVLLLLAAALAPARAASVAVDTACNEAIGSANGANGGFGFAAWTNVTIASGGGIYTSASDSSLSSNGCSTAWGIYTGSSSATTSVQRPFTNYTALSVGQTITVDLHNGGIQTGGSEGLSLYNASGNAVWELYFAGGASFWTTNASGGAGATTIPYAGSAGACRVFFTLTSATTYSLTAQIPVGGTNYGPFAGTLLNPAGGQSITTLRFYTANIGSGNNLQFNNLSVGYDTPTISAQPAATTTATFSSTTPAMTVTAASTDGSTLNYAWRKRGSGWGAAWTFDNTAGGGAGAVFLASSPEIDTGGQAWGLQQTTGTAATDAIRPLPSILASNQTLSVDMDNKSITTGGSVGISLQDSSGNNGFEFFFTGGGANYAILDASATARNTAVPFTSTGLHLDFTLTTSTNYTLRIKRLSSGSTIILTGTVTNRFISRVRFFDFESGGGNNAYFNNLAVAGADDNAGNYSSWSGNKGQRPLADGPSGTGSTNSGSATASFTLENAQIVDGTNSYDCAVMAGQGLTVISSASALRINPAPTSVTLTSSENPSGFKDSLAFTAAGLPSAATGTVQFLTNGIAFDSESLSSGSATSRTTTSLPRGTNTITAQYAGDGNYLGSTNNLAQVVTNHPPVAQTMTVTRTAGLNLIISLADLATNWIDADGDTVSLAGMNLVTTNDVNLTTNSTWIFYTNSPNVNDQISYSITDGQGGTNEGYINIVIANTVPSPYLISGITMGSMNSITSFGIPNYTYILQRATNLAPAVWVDISTNTAQTNGVINATDNFSDLGGTPPASAYYRLRWQP